jgi:glutaminyl-tRNA synthetase
LGRQLIKQGKAYVCDLSADEIRAYRGTLTEPGRNSPPRPPVDENLDLFAACAPASSRRQPHPAGEDRHGVPNMNMRDPTMYRILHAAHHRTGDAWCIYPMYDFTHGLEDSIEGITHSICTLEFENHRPLYDWFI